MSDTTNSNTTLERLQVTFRGTYFLEDMPAESAPLIEFFRGMSAMDLMEYASELDNESFRFVEARVLTEDEPRPPPEDRP